MGMGLGELFTGGAVYIIDSMPLPVCKRVRARRCRKVRGRDYGGYCAAKQEKFFGWRLHLICTADGIPVTFELLPAAYQDLTAIHELTLTLPNGARLLGDKGFISAADAHSILEATGVHLITARRKNMSPNSWADDYDLRLYRKQIETVYSQMERMGTQRLYSRTNPGFELKVFASVFALAFTNIINQQSRYIIHDWGDGQGIVISKNGRHWGEHHCMKSDLAGNHMVSVVVHRRECKDDVRLSFPQNVHQLVTRLVGIPNVFVRLPHADVTPTQRLRYPCCFCIPHPGDFFIRSGWVVLESFVAV
jgi:hypothetical protein